MATDWAGALHVAGFDTRPGVTPDAWLDASSALGRDLSNDLESLYAESDGVFDMEGRWWVIWPLDMLTQENLGRWASGVLPSNLLAFGDDGTGDAFCLEGNSADVVCWHPVGRDSVHLASSVYDFWRGWTTGTLTTGTSASRRDRRAAEAECARFSVGAEVSVRAGDARRRWSDRQL